MNGAEAQQTAKGYFDAIAAKDMSRVPWSADATLRTPLNPDGGETALMHGRQAILDFFTGILPAVRTVKFLRCYLGADGWVAGQAEIELANGKTLHILDAFLLENGKITRQQNHYDPRPATG